MSNIFFIVSSVCLFLLFAGFFIGFARNWCRSLIRLGIVLFAFMISLIFAPIISNALSGSFVNGTTLNIFNFSIDFEEEIQGILGNGIGEDFSLISGEVGEFAKALVSVIISIASFLIAFFSIVFVSLIIYFIVIIILKCVSKKNKEEKTPSSIGLRFVGAVEGFLTTFIICFAILIPIFGVMNVCDKFLQDSETPSTEHVASAYSAGSLVCGQLFYTEDEKIGQVEGYVKVYADIKEMYDSSVIGKIFGLTRLDDVGSVFFDYLTRVKVEGENVALSDEVVVAVETYNLYKQTFKENSFSLENNDSLDGVLSMVNKASESVFVSNIVEKLVPVVADRWINDDKFFGISLPVEEQYKEIAKDALQVFKATNSIGRIRFNLSTIIDGVKIVNDHNFIANLNASGLISALGEDKTIIKEVIVCLSATEEFKNNLPAILNNSIVLLYDTMVGDGNLSYDSDREYLVESYESEADIIQRFVSQIIELYGELDVSDDGNSVLVNENLGKLGRAMDIARESVIISDSVKLFMINYINSDKISFEDNSVKSTLTSYINDKWDLSENSDFKFEDTFSSLSKLVNFASSTTANSDIKFSDLALALEEIQTSEVLSQNILEILNDTDIIACFVGESDNLNVLTDILVSFIENGNVESQEVDLNASQVIMDLINLDSQTQINEETAEEMLITLTRSNAVMIMIEEAVYGEELSTLQNLISQNVSLEVAYAFESAIENSNTISEMDKEVLIRLFS